MRRLDHEYQKSLNMNPSGFTIVELLIVIVVIGILAAITIVAYNGIQARAKFTQQASEVDKIGKAIQLWTAENGKSIGESGHGYNGRGLGGFDGSSGAYPPPSLRDMLINSGYLSGDLSNLSYMLAPCTTTDDTRWVVLAKFDPAPTNTVAEQLSDSGCTSSYITSYSDPAKQYKRNYAKVF